ncbi:CgeB family protein [Desulfobaculum bizertense]|uniref:Spore maturation protein CgeB n=1 Tax=Desulfobaculum bizertense DSM 18034 TaxID=1121442 RepID=A0A1T4VYA1_9BACT|nr:glycosyltransferase [Desulfobaculum bizertense]SKA69907.1 spore maturation protein CgeB [Desulfobaculum bizertense DSM 18034]
MKILSTAYTVTPIMEGGVLCDIDLVRDGRGFRLFGKNPEQREQALVSRAMQGNRPEELLPVLLGSGSGAALDALLEVCTGPVAVVDCETQVLECTGLRDRYANESRVFWVSDPDPQVVLRQLTEWQVQHGRKKFSPIALPAYRRLNRAYYGEVLSCLEASQKYDFWSQVSYPKFQNATPRILYLTSKYFLNGELISACERLGIPFRLLQIKKDTMECEHLVEDLLKAILEFKPDFVLTINHMGMDREGAVMNLLEQLELPLVSWFVDNPLLILARYKKLVSDWSMLLTWDKDNIPLLKDMGFERVEYLPLGTDVFRFQGKTDAQHAQWKSRVSFIGFSMLQTVQDNLQEGHFPASLATGYEDVASAFTQSTERSVPAFLKKFRPEIYAEFVALHATERQLAYERLITFEATRQYRWDCVSRILPFDPLIAGDENWQLAFADSPYSWRWHPELNYYEELPYFYPCAEINFNCTSRQMKGAVNQRIFDVPASGSFVLSDHQEQMDELFEPGVECISYESPDEIPELVHYYLSHSAEREAVIRAARKRIMAEHTYESRMKTIIETVRRTFG